MKCQSQGGQRKGIFCVSVVKERGAVEQGRYIPWSLQRTTTFSRQSPNPSGKRTLEPCLWPRDYQSSYYALSSVPGAVSESVSVSEGGESYQNGATSLTSSQGWFS